MRRLAPLFAAVLCLSPVQAAAVSALFDFDDFPEGSPYSTGDPELHEPYTFLYGCDGKDYCTAHEVNGANIDSEGLPDTISTTRSAIRMEFGRYGGNYSINFDGSGVVDDGNGSYDFTLFLLDFDTPLQSFAARTKRPAVIDAECDDDDVCIDIYSLVKVYLWSEPGGQGDLVGSLTLTPYDPLPAGSLTVALVSDQPFRSANLGHAVSADPDCIHGGCGFIGGRERWPNPTFIDDILVSTVPEPSTAALLALGLIGLAAVRRGFRCTD